MKYPILFTRYVFAVIIFCLRKVSFGKIPPPIPVASILIIKKSKILGIRRADNSNISLPGGIVNWNEDTKTTAVREALEETGFKIEIIKLLGVYSSFEKSIGLNSINIVYLGKITSGKIKKSYEGNPGWFTQSQVMEQQIELKKLYEGKHS